MMFRPDLDKPRLRPDTLKLFIIAGAVLAAVLLGTTSLLANALDPAFQALKPDGRVLLMRHTQTVPGVGDPADFTLENCSTQRNLNEQGIQQARKLGVALKAAGVQIGAVLVSEWCRADQTARHILEAAGVQDMPRKRFWPLNNVWNDDSRLAEQVAAVRTRIAEWKGPGALIMVSHGVTIRPIIGRSIPQGGFFVIEPAGAKFKIVAEGQS